jgi:hypothetical protein
MANNCWNSFDIYGNDKVKKQVQEWASKFYAVMNEDASVKLKKVYEIFYPGEDSSVVYLGSKWVEPDEGQGGDIGCVSAWTPPDDLQDKIATTLYSLDNKVVVLNYYSSEDGSAGYRICTPYDTEKVYSQRTEEINVLSGDEDEEAEADIELHNQFETIVEYLIDDMPGRSKVLKDHLTSLDIDWDSYK